MKTAFHHRLRGIAAAVAAALALFPGATGADDGRPGATLLDGTEVGGPVTAISRDAATIGGRQVLLRDVRELRFGAAGRPARAAAPDDPRSGPFVLFSAGGVLPARIGAADEKEVRIEPPGTGAGGQAWPAFAVPLSGVRAIGFGRSGPAARAFLEALDAAPPDRDAFFIAKGDEAVRIDGGLRAIGPDDVSLDFEGKERRVKRIRIAGIALAPTPGGGKGGGAAAVIAIEGGGQVPADALSLEEAAGGGRRLRAEVLGSPWEVDAARVIRVTFGSDRMRFLSDLVPDAVEESGLFGAGFPHRKDLSVAGGPIRLGRAEYRKGIGVHARTALSYSLAGDFDLFAARIGIDDGGGRRGRAVVRVRGDGRVLWEETVAAGEAPRNVLVPISGVRALILEADCVPGGDGLGAQVDWAEARVIRGEGGIRELSDRRSER